MAETDLPEEVIIIILCWLPLRLQTVAFHHLFGPPVRRLSTQRSAHQNALLPRLIFLTGAPQLESVDLSHTASFGNPSSTRKMSLPFQRHARLRVTILGSCNGLVCVAFDTSFFYMWNPVTGFFIELPEPGFHDCCLQLMFHGLGYLSATDEYKVFATAYGAYPDEYSYEEVEETKLFSSRSRVWKRIRYPGYDRCNTDQGTILNEKLHWFFWQRGSINSCYGFGNGGVHHNASAGGVYASATLTVRCNNY